MAYILQPLLRIRTMREDRAAGELTAARQATQTARDFLAQREQELETFNATKEERRDRIWNAILGIPVSRERIDLMEEGLARIDEEGNLREDNVKRAKSDVKAKEDEESLARGRFTIATRNRMKIDEHKEVWLHEMAAEEEWRAEGELEDFTVRKEEL